MRFATWNVNSIRARLDRVIAFLERHDVDVLAFQETKSRDDQFPYLMFEAAGYEVAHFGTSSWNGVAVASRVGIDDVERGFVGQPSWGDPPEVEARAIGATCGGVRVWSVYVPNGRSQDDPHFRYKLTWLGRLRDAAAAWLADDADAQIVLAGDYNIAPRDEDVWSMDYYRPLTHVSPAERAGFDALVDSGYADPVRPLLPGPEVYTYWDYKRLAFPRREGMRIDFALSSPALAARVVDARVDRDERKGKGASDHAPVILDFS
jgi:exodeoxyribonuclease III